MVQGKKAKGRLESIQSIHRDIRSSLSLMGLDAKNSTEILRDLRHAALLRSVQRTSFMNSTAAFWGEQEQPLFGLHSLQFPSAT